MIVFPVIFTVFDAAVEPIKFSIPFAVLDAEPDFNVIVLLFIVAFPLSPACA